MKAVPEQKYSIPVIKWLKVFINYLNTRNAKIYFKSEKKESKIDRIYFWF